MTDIDSMDVQEAADFLLLHPDTVKARARCGEIPAYKPGRKWVFLQNELLDYLKTTARSHPARGQSPSFTVPNLEEAKRRLDARLGPVTKRRQSQ